MQPAVAGIPQTPVLAALGQEEELRCSGDISASADRSKGGTGVEQAAVWAQACGAGSDPPQSLVCANTHRKSFLWCKVESLGHVSAKQSFFFHSFLGISKLENIWEWGILWSRWVPLSLFTDLECRIIYSGDRCIPSGLVCLPAHSS